MWPVDRKRANPVDWRAAFTQAAQYGGEVFAPPQTANGIAAARAEIRRIKAALCEGGVAVEDEPNDVAPLPLGPV